MQNSSVRPLTPEAEPTPTRRLPKESKPLANAWLPTWGRLFLFTLLFAVFVFGSSLALDYALLIHHDSALATVIISDALAGLLAGVLFFKVLSAGRVQRQLVLQRLETISEMNHHIRNALQVISLTVHSRSEQAEEVGNIDRAVNRVEWALREILPKI
jgi:hypothetical protein